MDPETLEMSVEEFSSEEFDMDFEFDAPQFFDFTRPELDIEAEEAELWFEFSGNYPPSHLQEKVEDRVEDEAVKANRIGRCDSFAFNLLPSTSPATFSLKFNWRPCEFPKECTSTGSECNTGENSNPVINTSLDMHLDHEEKTFPEDKYNGFIYYSQTVKGVPTATPKSQSKPLSRSSTLTRPTASFLARQNKPLDMYSVQLLRKCQRSLGETGNKISSLLSSMIQIQDTKRQKLETGCLRKVSRLDQALFLHKVPGKVVHVNSSGRSKVTVPREPKLKTAQRAERYKFMVSSESGNNATSSSNTSKTHHTNKNVLEDSSTSLPKRCTPRLPHFQEFQLRTSLRATKHTSHNARNAPTDDSMLNNNAKQSPKLKLADSSKRGKLKGIRDTKKTPQAYESKVCPLDHTISIEEASEIEHKTISPRVFKAPTTDASFQDELPIESFNNLCLGPETNIKTWSKIPAEKVNMAIKRSESFQGNHGSCGNNRKPLLDVNRRLDDDVRREFDPQDVSGNLIFA